MALIVFPLDSTALWSIVLLPQRRSGTVQGLCPGQTQPRLRHLLEIQAS